MESKTILKFVLVSVLLVGCYKEESVPVNDVIMSLDLGNKVIEADGVSKQVIKIEIPSSTSDANNLITLITTKGLFDIAGKNTISIAAQNVVANGVLRKIATATLISSNDTGYAYLTATIKNYSVLDSIRFVNAYPDQIRISVDKLNYQVSSGGEVTVTVKLSRAQGKGNPTPGQRISLLAIDSTGDVSRQVGRFRNLNTVTDASGTCVNYFSVPLTSPYLGKVKFLSSVSKDISGRTISDSAVIVTY